MHCPTYDCRKEVRDLSAQERVDFVTAVKQLKADGEYDKYVVWHMEATEHETPMGNPSGRNAAHVGPAFLPWHREFIRRFERDLQRKVPGVALPYWDWTQDAALWDDDRTDEENIAFIEANSPVFASDFMGGNGDPDDNYYVKTGPFAYDPSDPDTWITVDAAGNPMTLVPGSIQETGPGLQRAFGNRKNTGILDSAWEPTLPTAEDLYGDADTDGIQSITPYDSANWDDSSSPSYRNANEGWPTLNGKISPNTHNRVHVWIDGDMWPMTSPNDPLFFLHHCFIDKLWADWQQAHPDEDYLPAPGTPGAPSGHRLDDVMVPFSTTPADVLDHRELCYLYDTDPIRVTRETPTLTFSNVPNGKTTVRAAVFEVAACENVSFEIVSGPTVTDGPAGAFGTPLGTTDTVPAGVRFETRARLWISYTATADADGTVQVRCVQTGDVWDVPITATAAPRERAAVELVLDESGSMAWNSGVETAGGAAIPRMDLLQSNVGAFPLVQLLEDDDAIGVVRFSTNAAPATATVEPAGPPVFGSGRSNAVAAIEGLSPGGSTSIGDGLDIANGRLTGVSGYPTKAVVVLTDGHENAPQYIADVVVAADIDVYAIGMGTPEVVRPTALADLTGPGDGFLTMTGVLDDDDRFRVAKYFLQVLAGVTATDIVTDPEDFLRPGEEHGVDFVVTEADTAVDVVLLGPPVSCLFQFTLETPAGDVVTPADLATVPGSSYVDGEGVTFYRLTLPLPVGDGARAGTWRAVVGIDEESKGYRRYLNHVEETDPEGFHVVERNGARYNLSVHARSDLRFQATLGQSSYEPGATLSLEASLSQYDYPLGGATVEAVVTTPEGATDTHRLAEVEPGRFAADLVAPTTGVYTVHTTAHGHTLRSRPFTRERTRTAVVWPRGDDAPPIGRDDAWTDRERLCELLECLTRGAFAEVLEEHDVDTDDVLDCLQRFCRQPPRERVPDDRRVDGRATLSPEVESLLRDPRVSDTLRSLSSAVRDPRRE